MDKLGLYNNALLICGERSISDLTENREPRRLLDTVYDGGGIDVCLEEAQWVFAIRTVMIDHDPAVDPQFGYEWAFSKPSDWKITSAFCSDESFQVPITNYSDENWYWYANEDPIYVKYVSNDASYGYNLGDWPASFAEFVSAYFAVKIVGKLTGDEDKRAEVKEHYKVARLDAKNRNAMAGPTSFPARGSWVNSRQHGSRQDRGNRGQLIG